MALSYYSNCDTFQHELIEEEPKLPPELYNDDFALPVDDPYFNIAQFLELDPNPEPDNLFSSQNYINYPLQFPDYNNNNNLDLAFQAANPQEFNFQPAFHTSKRQKLIDNYKQLIYSDNRIIVNQLQGNCYNMPDVNILPTLPGFSTVNKQQPTSGSLSAQSIAARQRRRKISEKTQELGKLIPGAQKLNTAEMFQAAYKYIKFLQAQVGILEFMGSNHHQEKGELIKSEEMFGFLGSFLVQEKLYAAEKCIVPQKFVQELANDEKDLGLKPNVLKEIKELNE
ncbi:hypothetical protein CASFOL_025330 [Castilleja foliolosa]|uniref:BHLH domain-containing protein n=1 Tax=Castilleja foliolosa TaxID=1961234 RepID=A0ABD3CQT6_9LAMI